MSKLRNKSKNVIISRRKFLHKSGAVIGGTQLYFKGDPFIAEDPWADHQPSLANDLTQDGDLQRGVFDIVLDNALINDTD